jgi:hypothetical protein
MCGYSDQKRAWCPYLRHSLAREVYGRSGALRSRHEIAWRNSVNSEEGAAARRRQPRSLNTSGNDTTGNDTKGIFLASTCSRQQHRPGASGSQEEDAARRCVSRNEAQEIFREALRKGDARAGRSGTAGPQAGAQESPARRPAARTARKENSPRQAEWTQPVSGHGYGRTATDAVIRKRSRTREVSTAANRSCGKCRQQVGHHVEFAATGRAEATATSTVIPR